MTELATLLDLDVRVVAVLLVGLGGLILGTIVRLSSKESDPDRRRSQLASLGTWWALAPLTALSTLGRPYAAAVLFTAVSFLGLREYFAMTTRKSGPAAAVGWAYLSVPVQYIFIVLQWRLDLLIWIPVFLFLLIAAWTALTGKTDGYLADVGSTAWGAGLVVFCLSHVVLLLTLKGDTFEPAGAAGLYLYVVLLTQVNDISQALWGRRFGRRKVTPSVSPNKTWEGLILGASTTLAAAMAMAPVLTPFYARPPTLVADVVGAPLICSAVAGLLIAIGGFLGDINMSAVKRDAGVKDSGTLLPGQGGVLDRIDSLTFTGPLFYYFVTGLYGPSL